MKHRLSDETGFSAIEIILVIVIVVVIGGVGYYVYHSSQKSTDAFNSATETSNNISPKFKNDRSATTSQTGLTTGTSKQDLQADLNNTSSTVNNDSQDQSSATTSLNDQSTLTAVPN